MGDEAGEVDRGLDAAVAAADHRDALALVERAVAVRAIGDALVAIFVLARHAELAPARAGRQDPGARLQRRAVPEPALVSATLAICVAPRSETGRGGAEGVHEGNMRGSGVHY